VESEFNADVIAKLQSFVEQTSDFVGVGDPWGRILYLNPAACKRLGVADYSDLTLADLFPAEAFTYYYEVVRPELVRVGTWSGEVLVNAAGSGAVPMHISTTAQLGPGGETNGGVVIARELSSVGTIVTLAGDADAIGRILEWRTFEEQVAAALADGTTGFGCAVVLATVDMQETIERHGVASTATVLRALAGRVTRVARSIDAVGVRDRDHRIGLLLRGVRNRSEALRIAANVHSSLVDGPVTSPSGLIAPPIECGVAFSEPGEAPAALFERASIVIRPADVSTAPPPSVLRGAPSLDEFRVGMSHGEVRSYAQAVVEVGSDALVGYRATARWHHPRLGPLDAPAFVPLIAGTGLANEVDLYVARETAAMLTVVAREHTPLRCYFPASERLLADIRTEQYLWEIADAFSLRMQHLCLQVDRLMLDDWTPALQDALVSLGDAGATLVVTGIEEPDDVPAVAALGFREIHVAPDLSRATASGSGAQRKVADIVRLAHEGSLLVAATGVDDSRHRDALLPTEIDFASGDLYGALRPTDTIE
jgi:EAL domain-containing protein (putative c-di-GMP-specific phosphodiesterase class I)